MTEKTEVKKASYAGFFKPKPYHEAGELNSMSPSKELAALVQAVLPTLPVDERADFRAEAFKFMTVDGLSDTLKAKIRAAKIPPFTRALVADQLKALG